ncbi:hypothetical protein FRC09_004345 [Ceratobasidium sp. 395]|nr:hypothetical protein FRC09_004345 [Ceratobasidium sp. 395]
MAVETLNVELLTKYVYGLLLVAESWLTQNANLEEGTILVLKHQGPSMLGVGDDKCIQWAYGLVTLKACFNTALLTVTALLGVTIPFLGFIQLASLSGDLKKGVEASIDVFVAKGTARLYLQDGNEVWLELSLTSKFFSPIDGKWKLITLCLVVVVCV